MILQLEISVRVINQLHENVRAGTVVGTVGVGEHQISQYFLKLFMPGFFLEVVYLYLFISIYLQCFPHAIKLWLSSICSLGFLVVICVVWFVSCFSAHLL